MSSRAQGPGLAPCVSVPELQVACKHLWNPATLSPPPDPPSSLPLPFLSHRKAPGLLPLPEASWSLHPISPGPASLFSQLPSDGSTLWPADPRQPRHVCSLLNLALPQKDQRLTPCGIPPSCTRAGPTRPEVHEWGPNRRARCAEGSGGLLLPPLMPHLFRTDFRWP